MRRRWLNRQNGIKGRAANRENYARRYGTEPAYHPKALQETMDVRESRYKWIRDGLDFLRAKLQEIRPDAIILVGDDQDENFSEENWPQLSLYVGEEFYCDAERRRETRARAAISGHTALAKDLLAGSGRERLRRVLLQVIYGAGIEIPRALPDSRPYFARGKYSRYPPVRQCDSSADRQPAAMFQRRPSAARNHQPAPRATRVW